MKIRPLIGRRIRKGTPHSGSVQRAKFKGMIAITGIAELL